MTTLKGQAELDQYKLTKREVADYLGISTNAVRMSMRGKNCHDLEYRFDGTRYLFKIPRRDPVTTMIPDHPSDLPRTQGQHHEDTKRLTTEEQQREEKTTIQVMLSECTTRLR